MLQWIPAALAGIVIIVAFLVAPSLPLPPPSTAPGSPAVGLHEPARSAQDAPPAAPARAAEAPATERTEQPSPASVIRRQGKRASPPPAEAAAQDHGDADANVRWIR